MLRCHCCSLRYLYHCLGSSPTRNRKRCQAQNARRHCHQPLILLHNRHDKNDSVSIYSQSTTMYQAINFAVSRYNTCLEKQELWAWLCLSPCCVWTSAGIVSKEYETKTDIIISHYRHHFTLQLDACLSKGAYLYCYVSVGLGVDCQFKKKHRCYFTWSLDLMLINFV